MKKHSPFTQSFEQLPDTLPVFPLSNAIVLPGGFLPLNIFEPRYLNMVQDAMEKHRLIGMIQPRDDSAKPELYEIGCAGRITRYLETLDGRLEILLTGLCRFRVSEELSTTRGYRLIKPEWSEFAVDYAENDEPSEADKTKFDSVLRSYLERKNMQADLKTLERLSSEQLVNNLAGVLPLSDNDKQMLIEADTPANRLLVLTAILGNNDELSNARH